MADHTGPQRVHGFCGLCIARCGTVATVEDGRFTRLDPDPSHPTGQALCAKGRAAPELVYHPERLTHPLRRTRPKGDRRSRLGADRLGRGARPDRRGHAPASPSGMDPRPSPSACRRLRPPRSPIPRLHPAADERLRHAQCLSPASRSAVGAAALPPATPMASAASRPAAATARWPDIANSGCLILWGYNPSCLPPDARDRGGRGAEARHAADRGRSAPRRARQQGRCLAAGAARHRRRARSRHRQPDDPARLVRPRLHPHLEQRAVAGARRYRAPADRARSVAERRRAPLLRLGHDRGAPRAVRRGHRPLRWRRREPRAGGRTPGRHAARRCRLPPGLRTLRRALPPLSARSGRGDLLDSARRSSRKPRG